MPAVMERHVLEHDAPALDVDRTGIDGIRNADRLVMNRDQLFHVIHRTLKIVDVHAHVTQIGVDDADSSSTAHR